MGSCYNKKAPEPIESIKAITKPKQASTLPPATHEVRKTGLASYTSLPVDRAKYQIKITEEEQKGRRSKKKLTVLSTNDDEINLPADLSRELSLVRQKSIGKKEQGSLLVRKQPVIFGGKNSEKTQFEFQDKLMTIEGDDVKRDYLVQQGIWVSCKKGLKPDSPNQDDFVVFLEEDSVLLGVFDGHGTHGHQVSNFVHKAFPRILVASEAWPSQPLSALSSAFPKVQEELLNYCPTSPEPFDCTLSGTTCTLLYKKSSKIYAAHVGDSRAVLGRRVNGKILAVDLTRDHKPTLEDEQLRINQMGGEVKRLEDDIPHRVFMKGKHYPGIAMSRTIGDQLAQRIGVVCVAEVSEFDVQANDEFIMACSDGVWEFISSQEAVQEVDKYGKNIKSAAEALATLAWNRWIANEEDTADDITVVLMRF